MAKTVPVKTLKKMLKKAGLKTTGRKAALTRRAKKAKLMKGGQGPYKVCQAALGEGQECPKKDGSCRDGYSLVEVGYKPIC
jgi:hypothetical protein